MQLGAVAKAQEVTLEQRYGSAHTSVVPHTSPQTADSALSPKLWLLYMM